MTELGLFNEILQLAASDLLYVGACEISVGYDGFRVEGSAPQQECERRKLNGACIYVYSVKVVLGDQRGNFILR